MCNHRKLQLLLLWHHVQKLLLQPEKEISIGYKCWLKMYPTLCNFLCTPYFFVELLAPNTGAGSLVIMGWLLLHLLVLVRSGSQHGVQWLLILDDLTRFNHSHWYTHLSHTHLSTEHFPSARFYYMTQVCINSAQFPGDQLVLRYSETGVKTTTCATSTPLRVQSHFHHSSYSIYSTLMFSSTVTEPLDPDDMLYCLNCSHVIHAFQIQRWLSGFSPNCI